MKRQRQESDIGSVPPKKSYEVDELFPDYTIHRKLEINAPSELHTKMYFTPTDNIYEIPETSSVPLQSSSTQSPPTDIKEDTVPNTAEGVEETNEFISLLELQSNKISSEEMQETNVYKNYNPGEQSMRLYIKNLSKHITDKDLRYIYGRYIDWTNDIHVNSFDVRVMQQGRMKGQAFVGMPSEELALTALQDTNGYLLQGRPLVVLFARSTKAKKTDKIMIDNLSKNHENHS